MIALAMLALAGCTNITNAPFTEDATYLAPLPSAARFGLPEGLEGAPEGGDAALLAAALAAGRDLDTTLDPLVAIGEALRTTPPDERTEISRAWDDVLVASGDEGVEVFHASAEVVQTWEGLVEWAVWADVDGDLVELGTGRGHADASGDLDWDLNATRGVVAELEGFGLEAAWDGNGDAPRHVRLSRDDLQIQFPTEWVLYGVHLLAFTAAVEITGEALPGLIGVIHQPTGGRARVHLYPEDGVEWSAEECWDADGNRSYLGGDGVEAEGDDALCAVEAFDW